MTNLSSVLLDPTSTMRHSTDLVRAIPRVQTTFTRDHSPDCDSLAVVKHKAWQGIYRPSSQSLVDHRITEAECHQRKAALANEEINKVTLPVGIQQVPKDLYLTSDLSKRDLETMQLRILLNKYNHLHFDVFLSSKEGQTYYRGITK